MGLVPTWVLYAYNSVDQREALRRSAKQTRPTVEQKHLRGVQTEGSGKHDPLGLATTQVCPIAVPELLVDAPPLGDLDWIRRVNELAIGPARAEREDGCQEAAWGSREQ